MTPRPRFPRSRPGISLVEVLVVLAVAGFFLIWAIVSLPRGRETARLASCQRNLAQIGVGLQIYHQTHMSWPGVPAAGAAGGGSPLLTLLDGLGVPSLVGVVDPANPPKPSRGPGRAGIVPGLVCPSDSFARDGARSGAISYRAATGATADGLGGAFGFGRAARASEVEAGDGLAYTVGFAERLVGTGKAAPSPANYQTVPGPVGNEPFSGPAAAGIWRGDAGSDWAEASWRSTLYNHLLPPNAPASRVAADGRTAAIGASSAHPNRINVLYLDGSVRGVTPTIDPGIWRAAATVTGNPKP